MSTGKNHGLSTAEAITTTERNPDMGSVREGAARYDYERGRGPAAGTPAGGETSTDGVGATDTTTGSVKNGRALFDSTNRARTTESGKL